MATFFSVTLAVSVVGLVTLITLKRYEMTTGHIVLGSVRPMLDRFFHRALLILERGVPAIVGRVLLRAMRAVRTQLQRVLARAILLCEHYLERVLHIVRNTSRIPRGEGGASQFLQEVAAHKQKLLRRKHRAIFEE